MLYAALSQCNWSLPFYRTLTQNYDWFLIWVDWPKIYIIVKQLSIAIPTMKRHNVNVTKLFVNAVEIPPTKPHRFAATSAGIRPYRSAIQPKSKPPTMEPQKNTAWAIVVRSSYSQTHSNWNRMDINFHFIEFVFCLPQWRWLNMEFRLCRIPSHYCMESFPNLDQDFSLHWQVVPWNWPHTWNICWRLHSPTEYQAICCEKEEKKISKKKTNRLNSL